MSEQAFVLLLPTDYYILGGVLSVIASIVLISLTPKRFVERMFAPKDLGITAPPEWLKTVTSTLSFLCLMALIVMGAIGPRDPLTNILPLMIWTGWWIVLFSVIGVVGNLWLYLNPWTGPYRLIFGADRPPPAKLPSWLGAWPGLVIFLAFAAFYIVDPAPEDPDRLAVLVASYWFFTFACMAIFGGPAWIAQGEAFSVLFGLIARASPFGDWSRAAVGFPGWGLWSRPPAVGLGVFALAILGVGSFDGLKETFWWMAQIDVNPLEFPGRTAVIGSSIIGLLLATVALVAVFAVVIWMGGVIANPDRPDAARSRFLFLFRTFAPTVLPIALGYHISHFFITFLINGQYLLAAIGDALATGANFLGLGDTRITTGFLNTTDSVRSIWLTQAGFVVAGHILAVLAAHHAALEVFGTRRRAVLSQIPLGIFMVAYTFFGLWLLAAPRGA